MGTRGLLGFIIKGKKHGVYVQFDSYLEGLGVEIVQFLMLLNDEQYAQMAKRLQEVSHVHH